jgi:hypothetical protein
MINEGNPILAFGSSDINAKAYIYHMQTNIPKFHNQRIENKITLKMILSEDLKERTKKLKKIRFTQIKTLNKEFTSNSSTYIYGIKTSIIFWGKEPFGILIKSKDISTTQKKYFNQLWKIAKP